MSWEPQSSEPTPLSSTRAIRALLAGLLVSLLGGVGLVLATAAPSHACSCAKSDLTQQVDRADAVFRARVKGAGTPNPQTYEFSVEASRAYKGEVERSVSVRTAQASAACGLGNLKPGADYLFLVTGVESPYRANSCGGSAPVTVKRVAAVERILGAGTSIAPPPPPEATMTKVEDSPPASLSRVAAPGVALVLLGLLGLVLVGRVARR